MRLRSLLQEQVACLTRSTAPTRQTMKSFSQQPKAPTKWSLPRLLQNHPRCVVERASGAPPPERERRRKRPKQVLRRKAKNCKGIWRASTCTPCLGKTKGQQHHRRLTLTWPAEQLPPNSPKTEAGFAWCASWRSVAWLSSRASMSSSVVRVLSDAASVLCVVCRSTIDRRLF